MKRFLVVLAMALLAATPPPLQAQTEAGRLIEAARAQIDEFNADSAQVLLTRGLAPGAGATLAEQQRGLALLAIVALLRSNGLDRPGARNYFEAALKINPAYALPDSLADLHGDARLAFAEARQLVPLAAPPPAPAPAQEVAPLAVQLALPPDVTLPVDTGRLRFETTPNRPARVFLLVAPADVPDEIVWADTQQVDSAVARHVWNLRSLRAGALVPDGRYAVRVRAIDAQSQVSGTIERILQIGRVPADTLPHPPPLAQAAFQPETLHLRRASPAVLLVGLGIGAAAAMMPSALGNTQLNSGRSGDATSFAVAGAASLAGIVGWMTGSRTRASPENARANTALRARDATERADIARRNAALRAAAPLRVRVEQ